MILFKMFLEFSKKRRLGMEFLPLKQ
jgi:hypothetical protein